MGDKYITKKEKKFGKEVEVIYDEYGNKVAETTVERGGKRVTRDKYGNKLSETTTERGLFGSKYYKTKDTEGNVTKSEHHDEKFFREKHKTHTRNGSEVGKTTYEKEFLGDRYKETKGENPKLGRLNKKEQKSSTSSGSSGYGSSTTYPSSSTKKKKRRFDDASFIIKFFMFFIHMYYLSFFTIITVGLWVLLVNGEYAQADIEFVSQYWRGYLQIGILCIVLHTMFLLITEKPS